MVKMVKDALKERINRGALDHGASQVPRRGALDLYIYKYI